MTSTWKLCTHVAGSLACTRQTFLNADLGLGAVSEYNPLTVVFLESAKNELARQSGGYLMHGLHWLDRTEDEVDRMLAHSFGHFVSSSKQGDVHLFHVPRTAQAMERDHDAQTHFTFALYQ